MDHAALSAICTSIPGRYAHAIFEVAKKRQTLDQTLQECTQAMRILAKDSPYRLMFLRMIQGQWKAEQAQELVNAGILQDFVLVFLQLLAVNRRIHRLKDIVRVLHLLVDEALGRVSLVVCSRDELGKDERISLEKKLVNLLHHNIAVSYKTQPSLLGGLVIKSYTITIDISVKHQIEMFAKRANSYFDGDVHEITSR